MNILIEWILSKHKETNHMYDTYLPYEFHLRMVIEEYKRFKHLIPEDKIEIYYACWGHDLIEDTRTTYGDIVKEFSNHYFGDFSIRLADIIFAVTNEKGKTREDRANDKFYNELKQNKFAVFVKLCDRIANIKYSKMTRSSMYSKYKKEYSNFKEKIYIEEYKEMFDYIEKIFLTDVL